MKKNNESELYRIMSEIKQIGPQMLRHCLRAAETFSEEKIVYARVSNWQRTL